MEIEHYINLYMIVWRSGCAGFVHGVQLPLQHGWRSDDIPGSAFFLMLLEDVAACSPVYMHFAARHSGSKNLAAGAFGLATGPSKSLTRRETKHSCL